MTCQTFDTLRKRGSGLSCGEYRHLAKTLGSDERDVQSVLSSTKFIASNWRLDERAGNFLNMPSCLGTRNGMFYHLVLNHIVALPSIGNVSLRVFTRLGWM
jgi:hypothetical protein